MKSTEGFREAKRRRVVVSTDAVFFRQSRRRGKFLGPRIALQNVAGRERENFNDAVFAFAFFSRRQDPRKTRRNFSRSAGLSVSSLRFIASPTVLA